MAIASGARLAAPIRREFGPANLWLLDDRQLTARLRAAARAMPQPDAVAIGMAGARTDADRARLRRVAATVWPGVPCYATNDLETCLAAADEVPTRAPRASVNGPVERARVLIVSGTGSCCYGRGLDGRAERLGGWGHVLGDRGSGYDITVRALRAVVCASDRQRTWPPLGQRFLRALLLNDPHEVAGWVQTASKPDVAAMAIEVFAAAADGDRLARGVLDEVAHVLAADGVACARLVAASGSPVQFVLAGSVLLKQPRFASRVKRVIQQSWPGATVGLLSREGAWGAVELARGALDAGRGLRSAAGPTTRARRRAGTPARGQFAPPLESLRHSPTERRNPRSMDLDRLPVAEAVTLMLEDDTRIPPALLARRAEIARAVTLVARAFERGGRLFYVGAGTSGRLGVLDASECPPTFRTPPDMVQGIIAGGARALWSAVEGGEDDATAGREAVAARGVTQRDVVVGIAASGRTPFVWGALGEARRRGARTVLLCFNPHVEIPRGRRPTLVIAADVGPEILTGSTRLKAGTATKMVLNVVTTLAMVRLGKVRSNLMIDVKASNTKLRDRAVRILQELVPVDDETARRELERTGWSIKEACARLGP